MIEFLLKNKVQYTFGAAGIFFILLSMFDVQDITKLQLTFVEPVKLPPLIAGIVFILLSFLGSISHLLTVPLSWTALSKVKKTEDGYLTELDHAKIEVCFGKIQKFFKESTQDLIVLPANDSFDDKCIYDTRSALGAFMNQFFPNKIHEICELVKEKKQKIIPIGQANTPEQKARYKIGTTVYLDNPLNKEMKVAFLATTTVKDNEGIQCEASDIFSAIKGLHNLMNTERLDTVIIPVVGSGHGGLRPALSLFCMLVGFSECLLKPSGHHIKHVRIVIFQKDKASKPAIPFWQVRRLLAFVQRYS
jgi:hypothetical protein